MAQTPLVQQAFSDIQEYQVWNHVASIFYDGPKPVHYMYEMFLITEDETFKVPKVVRMDTDRNMMTNIADVKEALVFMTQEDHDGLAEYRDGFLVSVVRYRIGTVEGPLEGTLDKPKPDSLTPGPDPELEERFVDPAQIHEELPVENFIYRGTLRDWSSDKVEGSHLSAHLAKDTALNKMKEFTIQLVHVSVEELRLMTVGGIYADVTRTDLLRALLTMGMAEIESEMPPILKGVDIVDTDEDGDVKDRITIPHGTKLSSFPEYMQEKKGIYGTGMGSYIQDENWYIWPLFDMYRYDTTPKNITIYNIPGTRLTSSDRTYNWDPETEALKIIATEGKVFTDRTEYNRQNYGAGYRYVNRDRVLNDFWSVKPKDDTWEVEFSRKDNLVEKVYDPVNNVDAVTKPNLNLVRFSDEMFTDNELHERSKLVQSKGTIIDLVWEYSFPEKITPGMPIRYYYMDETSLKELNGTLLRHRFIEDMVGEGFTTNRYAVKSLLTIFMEPVANAKTVRREALQPAKGPALPEGLSLENIPTIT